MFNTFNHGVSLTGDFERPSRSLVVLVWCFRVDDGKKGQTCVIHVDTRAAARQDRQTGRTDRTDRTGRQSGQTGRLPTQSSGKCPAHS